MRIYEYLKKCFWVINVVTRNSPLGKCYQNIPKQYHYKAHLENEIKSNWHVHWRLGASVDCLHTYKLKDQKRDGCKLWL